MLASVKSLVGDEVELVAKFEHLLATWSESKALEASKTVATVLDKVIQASPILWTSLMTHAKELEAIVGIAQGEEKQVVSCLSALIVGVHEWQTGHAKAMKFGGSRPTLPEHLMTDAEERLPANARHILVFIKQEIETTKQLAEAEGQKKVEELVESFQQLMQEVALGSKRLLLLREVPDVSEELAFRSALSKHGAKLKELLLKVSDLVAAAPLGALREKAEELQLRGSQTLSHYAILVLLRNPSIRSGAGAAMRKMLQECLVASSLSQQDALRMEAEGLLIAHGEPASCEQPAATNELQGSVEKSAAKASSKQSGKHARADAAPLCIEDRSSVAKKDSMDNDKQDPTGVDKQDSTGVDKQDSTGVDMQDSIDSEKQDPTGVDKQDPNENNKQKDAKDKKDAKEKKDAKDKKEKNKDKKEKNKDKKVKKDKDKKHKDKKEKKEKKDKEWLASQVSRLEAVATKMGGSSSDEEEEGSEHCESCDSQCEDAMPSPAVKGAMVANPKAKSANPKAKSAAAKAKAVASKPQADKQKAAAKASTKPVKRKLISRLAQGRE
eukprot:2151650-Amphidinium_carterae.2